MRNFGDLATFYTTRYRLDGKDVLKIYWMKTRIPRMFRKTERWFIMGVIGSGKSSMLERLAEMYLVQGRKIIDMFGSIDGEGLAWLRNKRLQGKRVLLVKSPEAEVSLEGYYTTDKIKLIDYTMLRMRDLVDSDLVIFSSPLFLRDHEEEFKAQLKLLDMLYKEASIRHKFVVLVREASEVFASRKRRGDIDASVLKHAVTLIRESRHRNVSIILDTYKFTSIDIDIRLLSDYVVFKQVGFMTVPDNLKWIFKHLDPTFLEALKKDQFIIVTKNGTVGVGSFTYPAWHKEDTEDILDKLWIRIKGLNA